MEVKWSWSWSCARRVKSRRVIYSPRGNVSLSLFLFPTPPTVIYGHKEREDRLLYFSLVCSILSLRFSHTHKHRGQEKKIKREESGLFTPLIQRSILETTNHSREQMEDVGQKKKKKKGAFAAFRVVGRLCCGLLRWLLRLHTVLLQHYYIST